MMISDLPKVCLTGLCYQLLIIYVYLVTLSSAWPYHHPGGNYGDTVLSLESVDITFVLKFASSSEQTGDGIQNLGSSVTKRTLFL
jgi:hypothetical protein